MEPTKKGESNKKFEHSNKRYSSAGLSRLHVPALPWRLSCFLSLTLITTLVFSFVTAFLIPSNVSAAAGTITISVPDQISLDLLPSNAGTFDYSEGTISVKTTYASGFTIGIAASTTNSNALVNTTDSSKTIPSISASTFPSGVTEANYEDASYATSNNLNNTWAYRPNYYHSTSNSNYRALPTSTSVDEIHKRTRISTSSTYYYTIYLGARVDATQAPGTYENTFVFTVTPNATPYTINYDSNTTETVTNMPSPNPQTGQTFDTSVDISSTVPVREGYNFKGWCTTDPEDDEACPGTIYNPDGDGTNLAYSIDQTVASNTIGLYAVWESNVIDMQTMKDSDCPSNGSPIRVKDRRDGEIYLVRRLIDGNCWLLDNLRLDPDTTTLQGGTNASNTTLKYLLNGGGTSSDEYPTAKLNNEAWTSSSQNYYSVPMSISTYKNQTVTAYGPGSGKVGVYYNYCAATAGSYCYGNGTSAGTSSGNAVEDLCPTGWRLPTGGTNGGEYFRVCSMTDSSCNGGNYQKDDVILTSFSFPLSGGFMNGSALQQNNMGNYWSSTRPATDSSSMYNAYASSSMVAFDQTAPRNSGSSLRCIKKTDSTVTFDDAFANAGKSKVQGYYAMQDITPSICHSVSNGQIGLLIDTRRSAGMTSSNIYNVYSIAKLNDGNCWMIDDLALDFSYSYTASDLQGKTNASNSTINYLFNGGGTTSNKYATAGIAPFGSSNNYSVPNYFNNAVGTHPSDSDYGEGGNRVGVYYNYCAASAGSYCYGNGTSAGTSTGNATEDLCPTGWRLPTGGESGEYSKLYGTNSYRYNDYAAFRTALSLPMNGLVNNGNTSGLGLGGRWWTSTRNNNDYMYAMNINRTTINTSYSYYRDRGFSIRCIANY